MRSASIIGERVPPVNAETLASNEAIVGVHMSTSVEWDTMLSMPLFAALLIGFGARLAVAGRPQ